MVLLLISCCDLSICWGGGRVYYQKVLCNDGAGALVLLLIARQIYPTREHKGNMLIEECLDEQPMLVPTDTPLDNMV
jgi:hypothetical protein